ncbi:hypothetical protein MOB66_15035 [Bacillus haynesii]|uniref:hypothetical protein n=1 Tax=Bacillus haynesii TaxID=1925021 RepID=UPI00227F7E17|nr:hypothetical protein [Bacillus haynesii]MCY7848058.1 hypothetical protein [Bacillus haynesii]MCY8013729.1 hypothetical protein [Bacillus haynesii]MCY8538788.1 hypothetical protein [Bacillus haynesii]MEC0635733.1 hypothetical protein [Bacillus haynesii]
MLEVTSQDISTLDDTTLRLLIGYLCEAEVCSQGLTTHGITYGGHQNAKDGGIDVRVNYELDNWKLGFIPRKNTGFQVKKPKMPSSEISKEMAPKETLRESIKKLVDLKGAYIIISSQSSTADKALIDRRNAMRKVIQTHMPQAEIFLDFYDSQRIATWVNMYPSLKAWVRRKVGRALEGWKGFENWAYCPDGIGGTYIFDENVRFFEKSSNTQFVSIEDGLNKLRMELRNSKSVIRLVGLSGVGKTRFVQALFDERVGENALEKALVLYTDIGDNPNPSPKQMLEQLILRNSKTYLIIDNCPPELHKELTSILKASSSENISLLTIEYDVKDETKEETDVYHLVNASENVISQVILQRYEHIDNGSAWHIAKLSGGNFRIANALASVVVKGENLPSLSDKTIFSRLFKQRNAENNNLEIVAEVCSLVYSFNSDTTSLDNMEIKLLSDLAGMSVREFLRNVMELESRDLIQKRGVFRAFLPHALANRLAINALGNIPFYELRDTFESRADWRLYRSFTKRLSFLHSSEQAKRFAEEWIENNQMLKDLSNMDEKRIHLLECIAPLNAELTLEILEGVNQKEYAGYFYSKENHYYSRLSALLVNLAYEAEYFERSVQLLIKMALTEKENENNNSIRNELKGLFFLYLSHTHATLEQRLEVIDKLIMSKIHGKQKLGISLLGAMLETSQFSACVSSEFGGHIRGLGYTPTTGKEIENWYRSLADYCLRDFLISNFSNEISNVLAKSLRGMWSKRRCFNVVEYICMNMSEKGIGVVSWISIKSILKYDGKRMAQSLINRLKLLEEKLRPSSLEERLQLFLTSDRLDEDLFDIFEEENNISVAENRNKIISQANMIGKFLSKEKNLLTNHLPALLERQTTYFFTIGSIVSINFHDSKELWSLIKKNIKIIDEKQGYSPFLVGILSEFEKDLITEIFNELVQSNYMNVLIGLQDCLFSSSVGINRLIQIINGKLLSANHIFSLRSLRFSDEIKPEQLLELLNEIKNSYGDFNIIAHFLNELIFCQREEFLKYEPIIELMHESLMNIFSGKIISGSNSIFEYSNIARYVYSLPGSSGNFSELFNLILDGISNYRIYEFYIEEILEVLAIVKPKELLELIYKAYLDNDFTFRYMDNSNPFIYLDQDLLVRWLEEAPLDEQFNRVKMLLKNIRIYKKTGTGYYWTNLGLYILNNFYENETVLSHIEFNLFSLGSLGVHSGSMASIFDERRSVIIELFEAAEEQLVNWAKRVNQEQIIRIEKIRKEEFERDRQMQYFEY